MISPEAAGRTNPIRRILTDAKSVKRKKWANFFFILRITMVELLCNQLFNYSIGLYNVWDKNENPPQYKFIPCQSEALSIATWILRSCQHKPENDLKLDF